MATCVDLGVVEGIFVFADDGNPLPWPATFAVDPAEGGGVDVRVHSAQDGTDLLTLLCLGPADATQFAAELAAGLVVDGDGPDLGALRRFVDRLLWEIWNRSGRNAGDLPRLAGAARDASVRWGREAVEVL